MASELVTELQKALTKYSILASGWGETIYLLNNVYMEGITSFTPPAESLEVETYYLPYYEDPIGFSTTQKDPLEGNIQMLESNYIRLKNITGNIGGSVIGKSIQIVETIGTLENLYTTAVFSQRPQSASGFFMDQATVRVYEDVFVTSVSPSERAVGNTTFTIDLGLNFTKEPTIIEVSI